MTERATILLAIKPEYAEKIYHGIKKYEYRKTTIRSGYPGKIVLYPRFPFTPN
jgi:predicted transcriptional regulator